MKILCFLLRGMVVCFVGLLITGCSQNLYPSSNNVWQVDAEEISVSNNLVRIWSLLRDAKGDRDRFPKSLSELKLSPEEKNLFVCPGTGSQPETLDTIDEWTDYIYIGGVWEGSPKTALIISPPENYQGKYGYVLCVGYWVFRLPPNQIRMLVKTPWLLDTNASVENIDYLKKGITVHIPKRLQSNYAVQNDGIFP
jgi:hypothetical protein